LISVLFTVTAFHGGEHVVLTPIETVGGSRTRNASVQLTLMNIINSTRLHGAAAAIQVIGEVQKTTKTHKTNPQT
jgi:hypothetical protein